MPDPTVPEAAVDAVLVAYPADQYDPQIAVNAHGILDAAASHIADAERHRIADLLRAAGADRRAEVRITDSVYLLHAHTFNAVTRTPPREIFIPLDVRDDITRAVLTAIADQLDPERTDA